MPTHPTPAASAEEPLFSFGLVADCQYGDAPDFIANGMARYFRDALNRLSEAVTELNGHDLAFVVHLGDLIDRDPADYGPVFEVLAGLRAPLHHLLGNHDFHRPDGTITPVDQICAQYQMPAPYYAFSHLGWRFIVLDSNEISFEEQPPGTPQYQAATAWLAELTEQGAINARKWNGGLSTEQRDWLFAELDQVAAIGERAAVLVHHPLDDSLLDSIWGGNDLAGALADHPAAAVVFSGHYHRGSFRQLAELPMLTLHGMVETTRSAFAVVAVFTDRLELTGYGRQPDRALQLRPA